MSNQHYGTWEPGSQMARGSPETLFALWTLYGHRRHCKTLQLQQQMVHEVHAGDRAPGLGPVMCYGTGAPMEAPTYRDTHSGSRSYSGARTGRSLLWLGLS